MEKGKIIVHYEMVGTGLVPTIDDEMCRHLRAAVHYAVANVAKRLGMCMVAHRTEVEVTKEGEPGGEGKA